MDQEKINEVAQFLVRIFGDEAADLAAERVLKSDQPEEWRTVAEAVDRLLWPRPRGQADGERLAPQG